MKGNPRNSFGEAALKRKLGERSCYKSFSDRGSPGGVASVLR